jgi:hypothetical protein
MVGLLVNNSLEGKWKGGIIGRTNPGIYVEGMKETRKTPA